MMGMLLGAQFVAVGFLAEMFTAFQMRETPVFSIKQRIGPTH
jgi:hypothetical protein